MSNTDIARTAFNTKRAGSLVGVITDAQRLIGELFSTIGESRGHRPLVRCSACEDLRAAADIDPDRMIATELSLNSGAMLLWAGTICAPVEMIKQLAATIGIDPAKPLAEQDSRYTDILLYGYEQEPIAYVYKQARKIGYYRGCVNDLRFMRDAGTKSKGNLRAIAYFSKRIYCEECEGTGLRSASPSIMLQGLSLGDALRLPVPESAGFSRRLPSALEERELETARERIAELTARLAYLERIGLRSLG